MSFLHHSHNEFCASETSLVASKNLSLKVMDHLKTKRHNADCVWKKHKSLKSFSIMIQRNQIFMKQKTFKFDLHTRTRLKGGTKKSANCLEQLGHSYPPSATLREVIACIRRISLQVYTCNHFLLTSRIRNPPLIVYIIQLPLTQITSSTNYNMLRNKNQ